MLHELVEQYGEVLLVSFIPPIETGWYMYMVRHSRHQTVVITQH